MSQNFLNIFAHIIKCLREAKNLTKESLGDLAGVHRTTIGLLENGHSFPTMQVAEQLATALGLPLSQLIQMTELVQNGKITLDESILCHCKRSANPLFIRNQDKLLQYTGLEAYMLLEAINYSYQTLDSINTQLTSSGTTSLTRIVELANLSSMVGNLLAGGIAIYSNGSYLRNSPHTYPDLLPQNNSTVALELKMALETNKPKGHLPKEGTYIIFRYVLGDKFGNFQRGKDFRGDTVWIWEVKVGYIKTEDFSCSNTAGDSGKTAVIKTGILNDMHLVYYNENHLPYAKKAIQGYVGYN